MDDMIDHGGDDDHVRATKYSEAGGVAHASLFTNDMVACIDEVHKCITMNAATSIKSHRRPVFDLLQGWPTYKGSLRCMVLSATPGFVMPDPLMFRVSYSQGLISLVCCLVLG